MRPQKTVCSVGDVLSHYAATSINIQTFLDLGPFKTLLVQSHNSTRLEKDMKKIYILGHLTELYFNS